MDDRTEQELENLTLAPYIQKATALIGHRRMVGGNQFRHAMATFAILIDYHFIDPVLLKASVIHDLLEDVPETNEAEIANIDKDGPEVLKLVKEVTCADEPKKDYLLRIRESGSKNAKILKVADRISNMTDLHRKVFSKKKMKKYIEETREYVYPIAKEINKDMAFEIDDLIKRRKQSLKKKDPAKRD